MRKILRLTSCLLLLLAGLTNQVLAQVNTASLTGLITDPSGAVVAGAAVTARNRATNVAYSSSTDGSGY